VSSHIKKKKSRCQSIHASLNVGNNAGSSEHQTLDGDEAVDILRAKVARVDSFAQVERTDLEIKIT